MNETRRLPPVWLMGFCNFIQGANGAVMLIAVPQLLAATGVPEARISLVVAIGLLPSVTSFVVSPILDWRFGRRSYSILLAVMAAILQLLALMFIREVVWLTVFLFLTTPLSCPKSRQPAAGSQG
jgi:PAT family beta-lactamase induction signal transducer AmpG